MRQKRLVKYSPIFLSGMTPYVVPRFNFYSGNTQLTHWGILFINEEGGKVRVTFLGRGEVDALMGKVNEVNGVYGWDPTTVVQAIPRHETRLVNANSIDLPAGYAIEPRIYSGNFVAISVKRTLG